MINSRPLFLVRNHTAQFLIRYCYLNGFMCFIEREPQNFVLKFRGIFLWRETMLRGHRMKSDEKPFFSQTYAIVRGKIWYMMWLTGIFLISERFEDFFNPRLSPIVPLTQVLCASLCDTSLIMLHISFHVHHHVTFCWWNLGRWEKNESLWIKAISIILKYQTFINQLPSVSINVEL